MMSTRIRDKKRNTSRKVVGNIKELIMGGLVAAK